MTELWPIYSLLATHQKMLQKLAQAYSTVYVLCVPASRLETLLGQSEQRVCQLSQALSENGEQLSQFQTLSQTQEIQIQKLQDVCTQLGGVHEENEVSLYNEYLPHDTFSILSA